MSDAWDEIQAIKSKRNSLRERLEKRKKERQDILGTSSSTALPEAQFKPVKTEIKEEVVSIEDESDPEIERILLQILCDTTLSFPITAIQLLERINVIRFKPITIKVLNNFLEKLATQSYITIREEKVLSKGGCEVFMVDHSRIQSLYEENQSAENALPLDHIKRKCEIDADESSNGAKQSKTNSGNGKKAGGSKNLETTDIMSLLSMPSTREKQSKQVGEEILDLLSKPTAKERSLVEKFKSQGGAQVMEFCPHGTRAECARHSPDDLDEEKPPMIDDVEIILIVTAKGDKCNKLHFKKIIQLHTDETLGDCSFLNTCFHMDSCKYVHYEVDSQTTAKSTISVEGEKSSRQITLAKLKNMDPTTALHPAQWIQCDLRFLDMTGNFCNFFP